MFSQQFLPQLLTKRVSTECAVFRRYVRVPHGAKQKRRNTAHSKRFARFGCGCAALGTDAPYLPPSLTPLALNADPCFQSADLHRSGFIRVNCAFVVFL